VLKVKIQGMKELERKLKRLPDAVGGRHLAAAVEKAAEIPRGAAESLAPRRTGRAAEHIVVELQESTPRRAEAFIGYEKPGFYLLFQELGTLHHPAQPHLVPALEQTKDDVVEVVVEELDARVRGVARG